ncbi:ATP-dependent endonuclease [Sediminibacterium sp. C3]|uniref:ATP-dependent nuclease n=1 Tax=Sediminibacterium sp. C3 TaxID=1267211 RepID=UPI0003FAFA2B|nr:AAA family ATPase [Sediminibacterium sp. C3]
MYTYKIQKLTLKDGFEITPGQLTVFVGPNNSGKSRLLKDILQLSTSNQHHTTILGSLEFTLPDDLDALLKSYHINVVLEGGDFYLRTLDSSLLKSYNLHVGGVNWSENIKSWLKRESYSDPEYRKMVQVNFANYFGNFLNTLLLTEDRLKLIKESSSGKVNLYVENLLQAFYREGIEAENKLRKLIKSAFGIDVRLDISSLTTMSIRVGKELDNISRDPMQSREEFEKLERLDEQGDGIKSFISTYLSILLGSKPVLLLDEPEAFLHPPQTLRLGEIIAEQASEGRQIFIATHSTDLLRGILNIRQDVTLLRLNRENDNSTYNLLDPNELKSISSDPLLSSSRILDGIFYKGVVVVEADSDATFYQRIARQIRNYDDIHYAHAHNKQTVSKVALPYKNLGVKFCVIVDFDILREKDEFDKIIKSLSFPHEEIQHLHELRKLIVEEIDAVNPNELLENLNNELEELLLENKKNDEEVSLKLLKARRKLKKIREENSDWYKFKQAGYLALTEPNQKVFVELSTICSKRGMFIMPYGELESWLVEHGVERTSNKSRWIVTALEKIPSLQPDETKEPWLFMKKYMNTSMKQTMPNMVFLQ